MKNALRGVERALFWTLAFAAFAAAAAGLAARAADRLAANELRELARYAVVRVVAPEDASAMPLAQAALVRAAHVVAATPAGPERTAAMMGGSIAPEDLPAVRLIELELSGEAPPEIGGMLQAALAAAGVTADVVTAPPESRAGPNRIRAAALWGAGLFGLLMAVIISLAARGLAARRRELVVVMTDFGASKARAAGKVADEAAAIGLLAGLLGAVLAGLAALIVLFVAIPGAGIDTLRAMILPIDLAPLIAAPLGAAIAAGAGARTAAALFHDQAARIG